MSVTYDLTTKSDGLWHEYVIRVLCNSTPVTSDAEFHVWVDGNLVGSNTGFLLHNADNNVMKEFWLGWMVYPFFQLNGTVDDGGIMYMDDFSTDSAWNSTQYSQGT